MKNGLLILLPAAVCALVCFLYAQGLAVTKKIAAILFVFRPSRNRDRVSLDTCTGWVRRRFRVRESRRYNFTLEARLTKGEAEVLLLDRDKNPLLKLNQNTPAAGAELEAGERYYLRWNFQKASGNCDLRW